MAVSYTLTYHRNYSLSDTTTQSFTQSTPTFVTKTISELGWTAPSGYEFYKWNTAADGSGEYFDSSQRKAGGGDLYAIWEQIPEPYLVTNVELTAVANAIRTKGGTQASLEWPSGFVTAIGNI